MYKLCIFDLDGTLIDSLGDLADSVNAALRKEGLPGHPEKAYRYFVGNGAKKLIKRALPSALRGDEALCQRVYETYDEEYHARCLMRTRPYPGIDTLIQSLKNAGVWLAVLSNKPDPFTRSITGHFFGDEMDLVLGQREGMRKKPAPDGVFEIMAHFGARPEETIFVGDSNVDVETAKNAGLCCLGVCWGFRGKEELLRAGADFLAENAGEAEDIILKNGPVIDKLAWIYLQDGKILSTRSRGKDCYYIPGGKRERRETDLQALAREVREELSVEICPGTERLYGVFEAQAHGKAEGMLVRMTCYEAAYQGELRPDSEIEELCWLTYADIERISPVDKLIFADLHEKGLLN